MLNLFLNIVFWGCVILILHSYIFYPAILKLLKWRKRSNEIVYTTEFDDKLPKVSVIVAAYNEELIIKNKILSVYDTNYPQDKIEVYVGSDNSTDATNEIITSLQKNFPSLNLKVYVSRTGKAGIINDLVSEASNEILILSDANVLFSRDTLHHLVKHYKNPEVALVGGNIINYNIKKDGISIQEKTYLINENQMKYDEGLIWGTMIGAFGGCYSIRKEYYTPVPKNYFMDDFFITMGVLKQGKKALNELDAICFEDVSNIIQEEFRRKVRISIGNFQNLQSYSSLLWPPWKGLSFSFMSHKVIRWFAPFLLILAVISSCFLGLENEFYRTLFFFQLGLIIIPFIDFLLQKIKIHIILLRFITHFYSMNLALMVGFFKYIKGVHSNVWQPTKRNQ
jgi:cellulose synthase/poly-beta-1,6-N-acetylglucosamine synthase-like glycosyltransferase